MGAYHRVASPPRCRPHSAPSQVYIGMDYDTHELVAMKRVQFNDRVRQEINMMAIVGNLSDVSGLCICGSQLGSACHKIVYVCVCVCAIANIAIAIATQQQ